MSEPPETILFAPDEPDAVVARMRELTGSDRAWINLEPEVPEEEVPPAPTGLTRLFGGLGPPIAFCTWTPAAPTRRGEGPVTVGIQHGAGTKARPLLAEAGLDPRPGWRVRGDHPRRGLVVEIPASEDHATVLRWLLRCGTRLTRVRLTGRWNAYVHDRSTSR